MAKRPPVPNLGSNSTVSPTRVGNKTIDISKIIAKAEDLHSAPIYSNHIQITSSSSELLIDFFRVEPNPFGGTTTLKASYLQRIIVPLSKAKALANAILQSVGSLEDALKDLNNGEPSDIVTLSE
jgi:hypothetical protein